jgi:cytochrome c oxidase accessory protein FixG
VSSVQPETAAVAPSDGPHQVPPAADQASSVLSTLNDDGSRRWLKPKPSFGKLWRARRAVAYVLIALFTLIPYIRFNGMPLVLLDLRTRHFTIFGYTFLPTDTLLLALLMVATFIGIFLITALLGRVWCGWACPQTVYMEFVYRPIERFFEGTPGRARKGPIQGTPFGKFLKYIAFFIVSCYLAHTFLAYFVGTDQLASWVRQSPLRHPGPFLVMAVVTALMMFDFTFFREQTCLVACPYGRFQSVLLDKNSLIVSYDYRRGEPRGKGKRVSLPIASSAAAAPLGDCVDCGLCVTTCPTGIDIRNGLQMECVNCAQCIDACNAVMSKIGKPTGLIRYASQAAINGEKVRFIRPRVLVYPTVLALVLTLFSVVVYNKPGVDLIVMRGRGLTFNALPGGLIANNADIKLVNRTTKPATFNISVSGPEGVKLELPENPVTLNPAEPRMLRSLIEAPLSAFKGGALEVKIRVDDGKGVSAERRYRLQGPASSVRPAAPSDEKHEEAHAEKHDGQTDRKPDRKSDAPKQEEHK